MIKNISSPSLGLAAAALLAALAMSAAPARLLDRTPDGDAFAFFVAGDMRQYAGPKYQRPGYFLSACEAMKKLGGDFLVSPGDVDPPQDVRAVVGKVFGPAFPWYPGLGNHDLGKTDLAWLRAADESGVLRPGIVRRGPPGAEETMYAFDRGNAHFVVLDEYYDGASDGAGGDISDATLRWLSADLAANAKPLVFVFGHEPAFPQVDMDTGQARHGDNSLNGDTAHRDRFWALLVERKVTAFICGHTHTATALKIRGVWQLDSGHARGRGDSSIPSTFLRIAVSGNGASYEVYRTDEWGVAYTLRKSGRLAAP
jgi:hypothetical protein